MDKEEGNENDFGRTSLDNVDFRPKVSKVQNEKNQVEKLRQIKEKIIQCQEKVENSKVKNSPIKCL